MGLLNFSSGRSNQEPCDIRGIFCFPRWLRGRPPLAAKRIARAGRETARHSAAPGGWARDHSVHRGDSDATFLRGALTPRLWHIAPRAGKDEQFIHEQNWQKT
jgi:hypothetical protein